MAEFAGTKIAPDGHRYNNGAPELSEDAGVLAVVRAKGTRAEGAVPKIGADGDAAWSVDSGSSSARLTLSTLFESVADRYDTVIDNAGDGGVIEVTSQGLRVSAGNQPNDTAGMLVFGSNVDGEMPLDKNPEFIVHGRYNNVDTGVGGDDIDMFIGWGPIAPDDFASNVIGLLLNAVEENARLVVSDGTDVTFEELTGSNPDNWATYRVTFDGETVEAYLNGELAASVTTNLPEAATETFSIGCTNRTDVENAGELQVTSLTCSRDF